MKREVTCNNEECRSVVINAYGPGDHFRHVMLVKSEQGNTAVVCPACGSTDINIVRQTTDEHRFALGNIVTTPGAADVFDGKEAALTGVLKRHVRGDWGDIDPSDALVNAQSIGTDDEPEYRQRLMSVYTVGDEPVWVITEAGHHSTTVLLPAEY